MISLYNELEEINNSRNLELSSLELMKLDDRKNEIEDKIRLFRSFEDCGIGIKFCEASLEDLQEESVKCKVGCLECFVHEFEIKSGEVVVSNSSEVYLFKLLKDFIDDIDIHLQRGSGIIFTGPVASGKTHASIALALDIIRYKRIKDFNIKSESVICRIPTFYFISMQDLMSAIASKSYKFEDFIQDIRSRDVLIIDDMAAESQSHFGKEIEQVIYRIIKFRDLSNHMTIITSNVPPQEFAKIYGKRAGSVLCGQKYIHVSMKTQKSWRLTDV
jgi:DNA replication protein DnaC